MAVDNINDINKLECRDKDYSVSVSGIAGLSLRVYPNGKKNTICATLIHISMASGPE
ncbi:hypothetical protein PKHYL_20410 [Psychrobacter sp. KH172YL61]|uniref:hypothetical protein n=1 Tax=Psychrobacter sp. KH172YL61 TaxID=2517899 RepID=UPI0010B4F9C0|nr:hypothetical protein [Psychrobacter sp. KH172YL61]BBI67850.1 hypothetical protein PKHYL_20410 [Psychrobacter sp. KH172YL61]